MKTFIFSLVLIFLTNTIISQTKLDSLIMVEVNQYRISKNLSIITPDVVLKPLANQHLTYMLTTNTVPLDHSQLIPTKYPRKFKDFTERCDYILKNSDYTYVGEVCVATLIDGDCEYMAKKIVTLWINSPSHNEALLKEYIKGYYIKSSSSNKLIVNDNIIIGNYIYCTINTILQ
jgi:uncharacterized protein YkwD